MSLSNAYLIIQGFKLQNGCLSIGKKGNISLQNSKFLSSPTMVYPIYTAMKSYIFDKSAFPNLLEPV